MPGYHCRVALDTVELQFLPRFSAESVSLRNSGSSPCRSTAGKF